MRNRNEVIILILFLLSITFIVVWETYHGQDSILHPRGNIRVLDDPLMQTQEQIDSVIQHFMHRRDILLLMEDYAKECWADSFVTHNTFDEWTLKHRTPSFSGFIEFLEKKQIIKVK